MKSANILCCLLSAALLITISSIQASALDYDFDDDGQMDDWIAQGAGNGGDWAINGGELNATLAGYQDLFLVGSEEWTDYTVEFKGKLTGGRILGMAFRYTDTNNNYRLNLYEDLDHTNNLYVYLRVAGAFSEVMKVPVGQIDKDEWYILKIEVVGDSIKAYLDGELKIEAQNDAHGGGGIAFEGETNTIAQFDDLLVEGTGIPSSPVDAKGKLASRWSEIKLAW
jgi:hypothetical protein